MKRKFGTISPGSNKPYKRLAMAVPLQLNSKETKLKNLLVDVAGRISATKPNAEPLVLRWAGGWVRDKLLGLESHDIDTAINSMTGEAFVSLMAGVLKDPKVRKAHDISPDDVGALYTVAKNPEKSKHLETASIKIFGLDLDFVNLRKETYTADSRNPKVEFGTAEEDALRRDATVNALFYNLMTDQVEDFTGGVPDLEAKLIRTPMEPLVTFMDDPLRVLRLVRFASRLGFSIDSDVATKMSDRLVLDALKLKISRERVGIEVEKMLQGNGPRDMHTTT
jgi:tRNA nucleotidyltransferase/poly(A) polymerase